MPFLATFEQPIETKGWLPERLEPFFPAHGQRHTKQTFNCCGEPSILEAIGGLGRGQIAVAGGETDVCVLQSVLGLIEAGKQVFLLEDALFSSEPNTGPAIRRMESAGAIPSTVKTLNYELRRSVAEPRAELVFPQRSPALVAARAGAVSSHDAELVNSMQWRRAARLNRPRLFFAHKRDEPTTMQSARGS